MPSAARSVAAAAAAAAAARSRRSSAFTPASSAVIWNMDISPLRTMTTMCQDLVHPCLSNSLHDNDLPSSVDWREHGVLGSVRTQVGNDSWAFATSGAIEAINAIVTGGLVELSKQQLLDCNWSNNIIAGGNAKSAFEYIIRNGGLVPEAVYPYVGLWKKCRKLCNVPLVTIDDYGCVPQCNAKALCRLLAKQPVVVSVAVDDEFVQQKGAIVPSRIGTKTNNHNVLAIGYDDKNWKIKNSWGTGWGDGGYAELSRELDDQGGCYGILRAKAYYPIKISRNRCGNIEHECGFSN